MNITYTIRDWVGEDRNGQDVYKTVEEGEAGSLSEIEHIMHGREQYE